MLKELAPTYVFRDFRVLPSLIIQKYRKCRDHNLSEYISGLSQKIITINRKNYNNKLQRLLPSVHSHPVVYILKIFCHTVSLPHAISNLGRLTKTSFAAPCLNLGNLLSFHQRVVQRHLLLRKMSQIKIDF